MMASVLVQVGCWVTEALPMAELLTFTVSW